jgi:hypothetical protein
MTKPATPRCGRTQSPSWTTCYPHLMSSLNIRKVGTGPRCYAVWLDHRPVFLDGLDGLPKIGDRFEIDGELWRVVAWTDRIICEREPS